MTEILGNWGSGSSQESAFKKPRKKERKKANGFVWEGKQNENCEAEKQTWRLTHTTIKPQSRRNGAVLKRKNKILHKNLYIYWQLWAFAT